MTGAILKISPDRSLELRYTARRAEKLESLLNNSLLRGLARVERVSVLADYIACGADISHEEALDAYDDYIENGGTMESAVDVVFTALENGGYVAKGASDVAKKIMGQFAARGN